MIGGREIGRIGGKVIGPMVIGGKIGGIDTGGIVIGGTTGGKLILVRVRVLVCVRVTVSVCVVPGTEDCVG